MVACLVSFAQFLERQSERILRLSLEHLVLVLEAIAIGAVLGVALGVLVNPLAYDGYPSIGCAPCTRRVAPGEDPRSGRWAGSTKTECGLHV